MYCVFATDICTGVRIGNWDLVSKDLLQKNIIQKRYLFQYFSGLLFNNTHLSSRASRRRYVFCLIISMWLAAQIEADMYLVHEKLQTFKQISEMNFYFNKKKSFPFDVLTYSFFSSRCRRSERFTFIIHSNKLLHTVIQALGQETYMHLEISKYTASR